MAAERAGSRCSLSLRYDERDMFLSVRPRHPEEEPWKPWIHTHQGQLFFGIAIAFNALVIGLEVDAELAWGSDSVVAFCLYIVQCGFVFVFVVELSLHLLADGLSGFLWRKVRTQKGVEDRFRWDSLFDIGVVMIAVVDLWVIAPLQMIAVSSSGGESGSLDAVSAFRILQLLRLVRIVRLLKVSKDLTQLVAGFTRALRSVFWIFVLLFVVIYIGALVCAAMLGNNKNAKLSGYFSSVWVSIYSHFKLMTLEAWPDICDSAMEHSSVLWVLYFLVYIIITNMALLNLVIGLIMDSVVQNAKTGDEDEDSLKAMEARPFMDAMRQIVYRGVAFSTDYCDDCNESHTYLNEEQFAQLLLDPMFGTLLCIYGIELNVQPDKAFKLLDMYEQGTVPIEELALALLRLRGSREAQHPLLVQVDLSSQRRSFDSKIESSTQHVCHSYACEMQQLEECLEQKLSRIEQLSERLSGGGSEAEAFELRQSSKEAAQEAGRRLRGKYALALLHQAASRARRANAALESAKAELERSLAREEALVRQVGFPEQRSCGTQTCGDGAAWCGSGPDNAEP